MRVLPAPRNVANSPARPRTIDWTNPLTRGLIACITVRNGQMVDLVNRNRTFTPTGKATGFSTAGPLVRSTSGGAVEHVLPSPAIETASGDWTYHILSRFAASAANGSMVGSRPAAPYVSFGYSAGGSLAYWHSGRGNQLPTSLVLPTSGWNVLSVRSDATANQLSACLNGGALTTRTGFLDAPMTSILGDSATSARGWFDTPLMLVFNRPQSDVVMRRIARDPWQIFRRDTPPIGVSTLSTGVVLDAPLLTNGNTFYGHTVVGGGVVLGAPLFTNSNTFYGHTVVRGSVTLGAPLYTDPDTMFAPAAAPGAVVLGAPLYTDPDTFYAPALVGAGNLAAPLLASANIFYGPSLSRGPVTLSAPLYTDPDTLYPPALLSSGALAVPLLTNSNLLYAPSLVTSPVLRPPFAVNLSALFAPTLSGGSEPQPFHPWCARQAMQLNGNPQRPVFAIPAQTRKSMPDPGC